jgi:hypothetical protein
MKIKRSETFIEGNIKYMAVIKKGCVVSYCWKAVASFWLHEKQRKLKLCGVLRWISASFVSAV